MPRQLWLSGDRRGGVVPPAASKTRYALDTRGFEPGAVPLGSLESDSRSARVTRHRRALRGEVPAMVPPFDNSRQLRGFSSRDGQGPVPRQMPSGLKRTIVSTRPLESIVSGFLLEYSPVSLAARSRPGAHRRSRPGAICGVAPCVFRCARAQFENKNMS